jgi:type IV secretory pathway VirB2 component (pilin)
MNIVKKTFTLTALSLLPTVALAAPSTYMLLAPLGPLVNGATGVTLSGYLSGIVQVIIGVAGILAVVMIVICGIQLIGSPSVSQKSASKSCITSALFGLILAFSSWLILNTINTKLLSNDISLVDLPAIPAAAPATSGTTNAPLPIKAGFYYRYQNLGTGPILNSARHPTPESCLEGIAAEKAQQGTIVKTNNKECFEIFAAPPGTPQPKIGDPPIGAPAADAAVRQKICGNDLCIGATPVGINKGPCTNPAQTDCTSVVGLPDSVVAELAKLGSTVGPIILSGGTEAGHATHGPGKVAFDIRMTPALNTYIRSNATQSAASFVACRYLLDAFWFTDETGAKGGSHWHVCAVGAPYWYCNNNTQSGQPLPAAPNNFTPSCPNK